MNEVVDVYRIARLLKDEHGVFAEDEIKDKIKYFTEQGDFNSTKIWYEIEDAFKEIENAGCHEKQGELVV